MALSKIYYRFLVFISKRSRTTSALHASKKFSLIGRRADPTTHIEHIASINAAKTSGVRTKRAGIICTIGPACADVAVLLELMRNGMNIARFNFSHGSHEYHLKTMLKVREATRRYSEESKVTRSIAIALDTKGPEIRTGILQAGELKEVQLQTGEETTITVDEKYFDRVNKSMIFVDYRNLIKLVTPGTRIFINDGFIGLKVLKIEGNNVRCLVENGGSLSSRQGVNLPGIEVDLPALSKKDVEDIKFGVQHQIDFVFASFIRNSKGVEDIRGILREAGDEKMKVAIVSKIENIQGLDNLDDIIDVSDGVMVARGDLGVELPPEKVFLAQKSMIAKCNLAGKPIICATQMLESMIHNKRPTRAEISDVANAILDGADCVMLSGETAKGKHPVECVRVMAKLCLEAEAVVPYRQQFMDLQKIIPVPTPIDISTVIAGVSAAEKSSAAAMLVVTTTGYTAFMVSRFRPPCPIIAITRHPHVARKCLLYRGVFPALHERAREDEWARDIESRIETGLLVGYENKLIKLDDIVIFLTGWKKGQGSTNTMRILRITKEKLHFRDILSPNE